MANTGPNGRRRPNKNTFTTRSGNTIKVNRSLGDRLKARRDERARRKAARLATLPKGRIKRFIYRLSPKRLAAYWFSRDGAIMGLKIVGVGMVVVFVLLIGLFAYFRKDLPEINNISGDKIGGSITYYDRAGTTILWQDYDAVKRQPVPGDQMAPFIKQATIATENKNFYNEGAFSVKGIARAAIHDVFGGGGSLQGGSTITQQVVKLNEQWTDNRTITRKIKELILAVDLEREYSKDDILTGYLNMAPYGGVIYGVEIASRDYFGISSKELSLPQAALLAAIPKAPAYYSPYSPDFDKEATLGRQQYVLDQMAKEKYITQKEADEAKKVDVLAQVKPRLPKYQGIKAPYFVLAAKQQLEQKYGAATLNRGGWKIITTLDMNFQNKAEELVAKNLPNIQRLTGGAADQEAVVAADVQTGQIVSLVGGVDFSNPDYGQNNYAAGILIPPGSSFKPYDYAALINNNNNVGAGSVLYDTQSPLPGYPCTIKGTPKQDKNANCLWNYDFKYPGPLTLRYSLGGSRNVPAVKAMLSAVPNDTSNGRLASINKTISTANSMMANPYKKSSYNCYADEALTKTTQCYGASAIGDGAFLHLDDHVNGLSTLARLGNAIPHTYILKITDASDKKIYEYSQPQGNQVLKPDTAYIVNDMASDPNASYLPGSCTATNCTPLSRGGYKFHRTNGWKFAIKTGTTNDGFDGLMTTWSSKYAVVTWVGNHMRNKNLSAARGASMESLTAPLARGMMDTLHENQKAVNWTQPSGVKSLPAFVVRNHVNRGDIVPSPSTDLFPSWYVQKSGSSSNETIDKVSGNIATNCTPPLAKETVGGGNVNALSADVFYPTGQSSASNRPANATATTDTIHNCSDTMPSITLTQGSCADQTKCTFTATVTQGTAILSGGAYTKDPAGTISLTINGQNIQKFSIPQGASSPYSVTFSDVPVTNGTSVQAEVIDSVLYNSTTSLTANTSGSSQTTTP